MQDLFKDAAVEVTELLRCFSFDLDAFTAEQLVFDWLAQYPATWVRLSLVEALYQGRYKAVSVEQILRFWQRRGQPSYHFNYEFERIIRGRFSRNLLAYSTAVSPNIHAQTSFSTENNSGSQTLSSEEIKDTEKIGKGSHELSEPNQLPVPEPSEPEEFFAIADAVSLNAIPLNAIPLNAIPLNAIPLNAISVDAVSVVPAANPSSAEAEADLLMFTNLPVNSVIDPAADSAIEPAVEPVAENAIQPFSDRLKLLSSEESIAFLKLRSFENDTLYLLPKDAPIQAFSPVSELETVSKPKWAKLAIDSSSDESAPNLSSTEQIHQFIPVAVSSTDFYSKLKAVAGESSELSEDETNS